MWHGTSEQRFAMWLIAWILCSPKDFAAYSTCLRGNPISMTWTMTGAGGPWLILLLGFFCFCSLATALPNTGGLYGGILCSLLAVESSDGICGLPNSAAKYCVTDSAAACKKTHWTINVWEMLEKYLHKVKIQIWFKSGINVFPWFGFRAIVKWSGADL